MATRSTDGHRGVQVMLFSAITTCGARSDSAGTSGTGGGAEKTHDTEGKTKRTGIRCGVREKEPSNRLQGFDNS